MVESTRKRDLIWPGYWVAFQMHFHQAVQKGNEKEEEEFHTKKLDKIDDLDTNTSNEEEEVPIIVVQVY